MTGQVVGVLGGVYQIRFDDQTVEASLRGRLKRGDTRDRVVVGDRVRFETAPDGGHVIEEVMPRETWVIRRPQGSRHPKVVAANLDNLIVVASVRDPVVQPVLIDRMIAIGEAGGLASHVIFNKIDLVEDRAEIDELADSYRDVGYPVLMASATSGEGMDDCRELLCSGSSGLIGPSGVGKSTIVNFVEPGIELRTKTVGRRSRSGRHTTVAGRLISLSCGGSVADTPGFSDVAMYGVDPADLDGLFPVFRDFLGDCPFRDCTHVHEPGCPVREAVGEAIQPRRYETYMALLEEVRETS